MLVLLIDKPIELFKKELLEEINHLKSLPTKSVHLNYLERKLKAVENYQMIENKRTEYEKIKSLKYNRPSRYDNKCIELCKEIPGISYVQRSRNFRVQKSFKGVRYYLGVSDSLDHAIEILNNFKIEKYEIK